MACIEQSCDHVCNQMNKVHRTTRLRSTTLVRMIGIQSNGTSTSLSLDKSQRSQSVRSFCSHTCSAALTCNGWCCLLPALANGPLLDTLVDHRLGIMAAEARHFTTQLIHEARVEQHVKGAENDVVVESESIDVVRPEEQAHMHEWAESEIKRTNKKLSALLKYKSHTSLEALRTQLAVKYEVSRIFCVFETETGQRKCLHALSNGMLAAKLDLNSSRLQDSEKFGGSNILSVHEACEPTDVIWNRLHNEPPHVHLGVNAGVMFATLIVLVAAVLIVGFVSKYVDDVSLTTWMVVILQELSTPCKSMNIYGFALTVGLSCSYPVEHYIRIL
jgi:hypothetical protein